MTQIIDSKPYDLEERTIKYAKDGIAFVGICPKTLVNIELANQVVRSVVRLEPITSQRVSREKRSNHENPNLQERGQRKQILVTAFLSPRSGHLRKKKTINWRIV